MARKRDDEHHIYKEKNGVWYFRKKISGVTKPVRFSLETRKKAEAKQKRDHYLKQIFIHGCIPQKDVVDVPASAPFGEVAQEWSGIVERKNAETTMATYRKMMNIYVLPKFENMPIDEITALDIEKFISGLKYASKTIQNILTPFRLVMKFALKHGKIQSDPFVDVGPIKKTKKSQEVLDLDEINRMVNASDPFWKPFLIVAFHSGARFGEIAALRWKNVDLTTGTIKIRETMARLKGGKIIFKDPKTEGSIRNVKIQGFVVEALREQRKRTWKGNPENLVFLNRRGRTIQPDVVNEHVITPLLKKCGIVKHITIKDARASYITNALDAGERISFIMRQVGHTTPAMIIKHYYRYTHASDDGLRLEKDWKSVRIVSDQDKDVLQLVEKVG